MAKKKNMFGVNTYVKRTKPKIGRHKKRMSKSEKLNYKKYWVIIMKYHKLQLTQPKVIQI